MTLKVLVPNRSEIACRIFQTCQEMGLKSVGVFAPGDEDARHLTYADEIYPVSSYLDIGSMVEVVKRSKAQLVHPGYGFLSERPDFAKAITESGAVFVGPRAETMKILGGKISAKELAVQQGIPVLPWAKVQRGEDILSIGDQVGYPLLLKASAGGGGRGMRQVRSRDDLRAAAESASAEALSAFGDGTLFLERMLLRPRHIEVQILGDGKGGGTHLHERECSLQRRHQKIWEEATAPHLSLDLRNKLFEASLRLMKCTQYLSAGTLEFLVDEQEQFYFLEVNTRLQVEHPTTEWVTGVDLVWSQISQALAPDDTLLTKPPSARGHAIEVRLYAEDPAQGFIPVPGKVEKLHWPTGAGIRVESGIEEGQTIGTQFDSMIAKLIVHGQSRAHALQRLQFALDNTVVLGLGTNQSFLKTISTHPRVQEGRIDIHFLESEMASLVIGPDEGDLGLLRAAHLSTSFSAPSSGTFLGTSGSKAQSPFPSPWSVRGTSPAQTGTLWKR